MTDRQLLDELISYIRRECRDLRMCIKMAPHIPEYRELAAYTDVLNFISVRRKKGKK